MDANGNYPAGIGTPTEIIAEKVCAEKGYIEELSIGECDVPIYTFPTETPDADQIITTRDVFILPEGTPDFRRDFIMGYQLGAVFKPNEFVTLPAGTYGLIELLELARAGIQALIEVDIPGAVLSYSFVGEQVEWSANLGIVLYSGNASTLPPNHNVNHRLGATTSYIGNPILYPFPPKFDKTIMKFTDYLFNDTGDVFEGDNLTLTGNLVVNGSIVSDLKTDDAIVFLNHNNPSDTNTTGWINYNTSNTLASGILRDKDNKRFYLFNSSPVASISPGLNAPASNGFLSVQTLEASVVTGKGSLLDLELLSQSRIAISATNTYMRSPDINTYAQAENNLMKLYSTDGINIGQFSMAPTSSTLINKSTIRFLTNDNVTTIQSPNGGDLVELSPLGGFTHERNNIDRMVANDDGTLIQNEGEYMGFHLDEAGVNVAVRAYLDDGKIELDEVGNFNVYTNDGVRRIDVDPVVSRLYAPNQNNWINIQNIKYAVQFNSVERIFMNSSQLLLIAENNATQAIVRNNQIELLVDDLTDTSSLFVNPTTGSWSIDSVNRLDFTDTQTQIKQKNQDGLFMDALEIYLRKTGVKQLQIDATSTLIRSPDLQSIINAENGIASVALQTNEMVITPTDIKIRTNSIERLELTSTDTILSAPDGLEELKVKDDGLFYKKTGITEQSVPLGVAVQTSDVIITGGTPPVETSMLSGTIIGSLTVPANILKPGDSFHARLSGLYTGANNDTIQIKLKSGATVLADSGTITLQQATARIFELEIDFTIRQIGSATTASIHTSGTYTYNRDAQQTFEGAGFSTTNSTTFDTTISNTLDITIQHSATAQNTTCQNFRMTQTY